MQYRPEVKGQTTHYYDLKSNPRLNDPIVQRDCFVEVFYAPNEGLIFRLKNELWGSYVDFPNNVNVSVTAMDVNREKYVFQAKTSGPKSSWDVIDHIFFDKEGFQEIERLLLEEKPLGFSVLIDPENSTFGLRGFSFVFTPRFFKDACGVFN
jgi:hypothetical protein